MLKQQLNNSEVHGLQRVLKVGVGLACTTSVNIKTDNGLINGASMYTEEKYITSRVMLVNIQIFLWVLFDDETIGKLWRQKYSAYYNEGIGKTWSPIFGVTRHSAVSNGKSNANSNFH